jgi:hypothetical protein
MQCPVALVRTDISEELIAFFLRVKCTSELETALAVLQLLIIATVVPSLLILFTLMIETRRSSEPSSLFKDHTASHLRRRHSP